MSPGDESRSHSVTDTSSTLTSGESGASSRRIPGLAILLEADRPEAAPTVFSLEGIVRVEFRRGKERRADRSGQALIVQVPDQRMSKPHADIDLASGGTLRDAKSSNGCFVDDVRGEQQVEASVLSDQQIFRLGHTFAMLVDDAGALLARGASPWPFITLAPSFAASLSRLERVAASTLPLLLLGETGTGKEILARAIHDRSQRPGPFVAVNCGALPPNLVEAHLFGHQKGSFSGAVRDEVGFVRAAQHGTLFLDEIGDLPLSSQASLLRVLQEGEVTPVGAFQPTKVDVRIVSATHAHLAESVTQNAFRADLYARLAGFAFAVPPLRERMGDLGAMIATLCAQIRTPFTFRPDAVWTLFGYDYPMNVRELRHAIEAAAILSDHGAIASEHLPEAMRTIQPLPLDGADSALRTELSRRLVEHGGNLSRVARDMGKARQQVQRWVKRLGLKA